MTLGAKIIDCGGQRCHLLTNQMFVSDNGMVVIAVDIQPYELRQAFMSIYNRKAPKSCVRAERQRRQIRERMYAFTVPVNVLTRFLWSVFHKTLRLLIIFILSMNVGRTKAS